jgi:hypothetical protein
MNPQTWNAMVGRGVTMETPLRLDFAYAAPGEEEANQLSGFLRRETDYTVHVNFAQEGAVSSRVWFVEGNTNETQLSLDTLNEWVRWMVLAGAENGDCEFDGWGAHLPR